MVLRCDAILVLVILASHTVLGAPSDRYKRDDNKVAAISSDANPVTYKDGEIDGLDRVKRTASLFNVPSAVVNFAFDGINRVLNFQVKLLDSFEKRNLQMNIANNIEPTKPISSTGLLQSIIRPALSAISPIIESLRTSILGAGRSVGGVFTSIFRFSGPILSSSSNSGRANTAEYPNESLTDDDTE